MPWEKSFNEDHVIEKAMKLFWEKGYKLASIADLITTMDINRGSLYNAFGGKRQLFVKALLKYDQENRRAILAQLEALDDPKQAINLLFDGIIAEMVADKDKKGCFLINTASELAIHDKEVKSIVTKGLGEFEAFLRRGIEVAQARNDISPAVDAEATAKTLLALIVSIRVLGRGVFGKNALDTIAYQAKQLIC